MPSKRSSNPSKLKFENGDMTEELVFRWLENIELDQMDENLFS